MDYLVDAGMIERVRGTSERDAALMTVMLLGDRAQFPIDVYALATGDKMTFVREGSEEADELGSMVAFRLPTFDTEGPREEPKKRFVVKCKSRRKSSAKRMGSKRCSGVSRKETKFKPATR
jgi:hypothetical protein